MLEVKGCLDQSCDGLTFKDITGTYNVVDNPNGYGIANVILGPSGFDTYELRLWDPSNNYYSETPVPTVVLDLLTLVPPPDSQGFYSWDYIASQIGVSEILDGAWFWEVIGVKDADEYRTQGFGVFINILRAKMDAKLKAWDPTCPCKKGCQDIGELYSQFLVLEAGGTCDSNSVGDVIKWLSNKLKNCC